MYEKNVIPDTFLVNIRFYVTKNKSASILSNESRFYYIALQAFCSIVLTSRKAC